MRFRLNEIFAAAAMALAMAAAASCSETTDKPSHNERDYDFELAVDDDKATVVPPGTITTGNIRNFRVSAFNSSNPNDMIIRNIEVVRTGLNTWTYSPSVEWPDYPIDFEAVTPSSVEIATFGSWLWGYPSTVNLDTHGEGKIDFCVAAARSIHQTEGRIRLNFRHAMARINMVLAADIPGADLIVKKIDMFNVCGSSTFLFPKGSTYPRNEIGQLEDCWADWTQSNANDTIAVFISKDPEGLAIDTTYTDVGNQDNIFYIPYKFRHLYENNGHITGSGIRILCKVTEKETGNRIWPHKNTPYQLVPNQWGGKWGYIFFPLGDTSQPAESDRNRWRPGYHYNYRIRITREGSLPPRSVSNAKKSAGVSAQTSNTLEVTAIPY